MKYDSQMEKISINPLFLLDIENSSTLPPSTSSPSYINNSSHLAPYLSSITTLNNSSTTTPSVSSSIPLNSTSPLSSIPHHQSLLQYLSSHPTALPLTSTYLRSPSPTNSSSSFASTLSAISYPSSTHRPRVPSTTLSLSIAPTSTLSLSSSHNSNHDHSLQQSFSSPPHSTHHPPSSQSLHSTVVPSSAYSPSQQLRISHNFTPMPIEISVFPGPFFSNIAISNPNTSVPESDDVCSNPKHLITLQVRDIYLLLLLYIFLVLNN